MLMQSVTESWTHGADPTVCLLSESELKRMRERGVNNVMKELIRKYLIPTSNNNGIKSIIVNPDEGFFDKQVSVFLFYQS